ncbi:MAG: prepilin-type N-terminal cleavage/methylation domain-containing protein [Myxococcales bacterium]|nr:prepilin-type N-terminal cleavage/methylation domain-containing protein [Myxococcales bacterium]
MGSRRGFTLIELVAAIAIIAIVTAAVATGVNNIRGASASAEAGKIAVAVRYLYNLAVVSGRNQRLVIDFDARAWWGEEQTTDDPCEAFLLPGTDEPGTDKHGTDKHGTDKHGKDEPEDTQAGNAKAGERPAATSAFEASKSTLLQRTELDKGLTFAAVMTTHQSEPSKSGQAFIYFFPNGTTEHAMIQVKADEDDVTTVEVSAMQGTAKIRGEDIDLDDISREFAKDAQ